MQNRFGDVWFDVRPVKAYLSTAILSYLPEKLPYEPETHGLFLVQPERKSNAWVQHEPDFYSSQSSPAREISGSVRTDCIQPKCTMGSKGRLGTEERYVAWKKERAQVRWTFMSDSLTPVSKFEKRNTCRSWLRGGSQRGLWSGLLMRRH